MDQWYCEIAGREIGPLSSQQLRTMVAKGQILPNDRVRHGEQTAWLAARSVKGLFPQAAPSKPGLLPVAQAAPKPRAVPPPPPSPTQPSWPLDVADPIAINIVTDPLDDDRDTPAGAELTSFLRSKRRVRQQQMTVILLLVAIVGLAVAGLLLALGGRSSEPNQTEAATAAKKAPTAKAEVESPEALEAREGVESLDPAKPKRRKNNAEAPKTPAAIENFAVKVAAAVRTVPRGAPTDEATPAADSKLLITVEVANASDTRKLEFAGWARGGIARDAKLTDNFGNVYRAKPVGRAAASASKLPMSIYPGRSGREVLAFETPIKKAESLTLELPGGVLGKSGTVKLNIPTTTIVEQPAADDSKPAVPKKQPQPGTPQGDFGLPEVDPTSP